MNSEVCSQACGWKPTASFKRGCRRLAPEVKLQTAGQTCLYPLAPGVAASHRVLAGVPMQDCLGVALLPSRIKASMIQSCYAPNFDAF